MKAIAKIISYVFHPLLIATWAVLLMIYTNPVLFLGSNAKVSFFLVFINTFCFPAIAILLMRQLGFVESLEMPDSKQRILPMVAAIIFYVWAYMAVRKTSFPATYSMFMLGSVISLCISFVINVFHKLSLHMVGISGFMMCLMLLIMYSQTDVSLLFIFSILLTGLVATSRLYLGAHTIREVNTGFLVGMFGQVLAVLLFH
jgi:hypothetical protein